MKQKLENYIKDKILPMKGDYTTMELCGGNERLLMSGFLFEILLSQRRRFVWL